MTIMGSSPTRTRRGRTLIVGESRELADLASRLQPQPVQVQTVFDAMGAITAAPAGEPVIDVVIAEAVLDSNARKAIHALRKVDPSVRLIALAQPEGALTKNWMDTGLDECIATPIDQFDLARVFDDESLASEMTAPPQPKPESRPDQPTENLRPDSPREVETSSRSTPSKTLGDTDLVESLLTSPNQLRDIAVTLVTQHTGWTDLKLHLDASSLPAHAAACEAVFRGQFFGVLSTGQATGELLKPWADWLARWLALDDLIQKKEVEAMKDDLTTAWNRRYFHKVLGDSIASARKTHEAISVLVFDIDDFKAFNDHCGHEAGDEILCEIVKLIESIIRKGDRVCRIGGDEFAVIFTDPEGPRQLGSKPLESIDVIIKRFQQQVCSMRFPKLTTDAPNSISISAGLATYPWDGLDSVSLLRHADHLALESKRKGKNLLTLGPGAQRHCDEANGTDSDS